MDKPIIEERDWVLDDHDWSHKAWMSKLDADIFEELLIKISGKEKRIKILEWGSGKSTSYYTNFLSDNDIQFEWDSLEYDREYFLSDLSKNINENIHTESIFLSKTNHLSIPKQESNDPNNLLRFFIFNYGRLFPMLKNNFQDREVNMDDYVNLPTKLKKKYDLILVDGRKRRRCVLQSKDLLSKNGIVFLHDAWRPYYHCAFEEFKSSSFVGDISWIGSNCEEDFFHSLLQPS